MPKLTKLMADLYKILEFLWAIELTRESDSYGII